MTGAFIKNTTAIITLSHSLHIILVDINLLPGVVGDWREARLI